MPPFLFVHGTADKLVPFNQSVEMCNAVRASGGTCEVLPIQGGGHGIHWWETSVATSFKAKMITWLQEQLNSPHLLKS